eukprot:320253-Prymnesium_polylepis.1
MPIGRDHRKASIRNLQEEVKEVLKEEATQEEATQVEATQEEATQVEATQEEAPRGHVSSAVRCRLRAHRQIAVSGTFCALRTRDCTFWRYPHAVQATSSCSGAPPKTCASVGAYPSPGRLAETTHASHRLSRARARRFRAAGRLSGCGYYAAFHFQFGRGCKRPVKTCL